jgi:hypothetical protein|tara:strand:+ start:29 stop:238 length:210 start_codon:yes stop_codon:yes gene_type:complete
VIKELAQLVNHGQMFQRKQMLGMLLLNVVMLVCAIVTMGSVNVLMDSMVLVVIVPSVNQSVVAMEDASA